MKKQKRIGVSAYRSIGVESFAPSPGTRPAGVAATPSRALFLVILLSFAILLLSSPAHATTTGRTVASIAALKAIDGSTGNPGNTALLGGDFAFIFDASGNFSAYALDASNNSAESLPDIVTPTSNAGVKRWILQSPASVSGTDGTRGVGLKNNTSSITTPAGYDGIIGFVGSVPVYRIGTGTVVTLAPVGQTFYLGTTQVAINRGSGALSLSGVSIDGTAGGLSFGSDAQDDIPARGASAYGRLNAGEQTMLGRITGGHLAFLSTSQIKTLLGYPTTRSDIVGLWTTCSGYLKDGGTCDAGPVSDTVYDASSWDSVTTIAPSKNAVRDLVEARMPAGSDGTYGVTVSNNTSSYTCSAGVYGFNFIAGNPYFCHNGTNTAFSSYALVGQTFYVGTTQVAINRTSGALSLTGVSIDGTAGGLSFGSDDQDDIPARGASAYGRLNAAEQTMLGRITGGHLAFLSTSQIKTLLGYPTSRSDVVGLWTTCTSGYLKYDGTCDTPSGAGDLVHSGTPAAYQWGVFTDSSHIKGVAVTPSKVACTDASGNPIACTNLTDAAIPTAYGSNPAMDGTANSGSSANFAKGDHVHPSDTSKANAAVNNVGSFASPTTSTGTYSLSAANAYNTIVYYNDTDTLALPAAVAGMNLCIYVTGTNLTTIDPNGTDVVVRDGTAQSAGVSFTLTGVAGNYVCLEADAANHWVTLGFRGTLAQGS